MKYSFVRPTVTLRPRAALARLTARRWASTDSNGRLFAGIRRNLTLWYSGVLAAAFVLFGVALYNGVQTSLLDPVNRTLATRALYLSLRWQSAPQLGCGGLLFPARLGPLPGRGLIVRAGSLWACYDNRGRLSSSSPLASQIPAFTGGPIAQTAMQSRVAVDTVNTGGDIGSVQRYAIAVPAPSGSGRLGVIVIGQIVTGTIDALHTLLWQLLAYGALAVLVAAAGGLLLSHRALAPARLALRRQQTFIGDASHELRTPLTLLRADAEVLLRGRGRLQADDAELLDDIVDETAHMAALIDNMLHLARLDAGQVQPERETVDLKEVTRAVARRVAALCAHKGIALHEGAGAPVMAVGDRLLLEQATLILADNAIKYNRPGGSITLDATADEGGPRISVCDTGIGIAAEHLPHLGERFYRVDKARSRDGGGAGLGLSIARGIAALHGGTLLVTSQPGQGTSAALVLPRGHSGE